MNSFICLSWTSVISFSVDVTKLAQWLPPDTSFSTSIFACEGSPLQSCKSYNHHHSAYVAGQLRVHLGNVLITSHIPFKNLLSVCFLLLHLYLFALNSNLWDIANHIGSSCAVGDVSSLHLCTSDLLSIFLHQKPGQTKNSPPEVSAFRLGFTLWVNPI